MDERVRNGGLAGALAFIVLVVVGLIWPEITDQIPTGFEAALTTVFATGVAYLVPRQKGGFDA